MNSGQMLFAIGALVLLGKLALSGNALLLDNQILIWQTEAIETATGIAQSTLEKIEVRGYDEKAKGGSDTVTTTVFSTTLGPDVTAGDTSGKPSSYDDIDDFDAFSDSVSTPRFGKFYISCDVNYVNVTSPYSTTASKTFMKSVDVTVTNSFMVDANDKSRKLTSGFTLSKFISYR
jgi:hypothetical protein